MQEKKIKQLISESLPEAVSYANYRKTVDKLAADGLTSGHEQKESLINYTQLNSRRLKRWDKTFKISEEEVAQIKDWDRKVLWLVLTESWCGDAAPTMPVMNRIADLNANIKLKVLLRDEHPELMNHFLTNNAMSIPKLIVLDENTLEVLGEWGPRPSKATQMAADYKRKHGALTPEFKEQLQQWYNTDKGKNTLDDLLQLLALKDVSNSTLL